MIKNKYCKTLRRADLLIIGIDQCHVIRPRRGEPPAASADPRARARL